MDSSSPAGLGLLSEEDGNVHRLEFRQDNCGKHEALSPDHRGLVMSFCERCNGTGGQCLMESIGTILKLRVN